MRLSTARPFLVVLLFLGCGASTPQAQESEAVADAITRDYPVAQVDSSGAIDVKCVASQAPWCRFFIPAWAPVEAVKDDTLATLAPAVRLFTTTLFGMHSGPQDVPVLAAVNGDHVGYTLMSGASLVAPGFLEAFEGVAVPEQSHRAVAEAIARLLATSLHGGGWRSSERVGECEVAAVRRGFSSGPDRPLFDIWVCYNPDSTIGRVEARAPRS
jgi:hypothetical protein